MIWIRGNLIILRLKVVIMLILKRLILISFVRKRSALPIIEGATTTLNMLLIDRHLLFIMND